jgi:DNA anti-recombination protein RmuC
MAQQASFIDEGIDQVKEAFSNVGDEFEKLQKNLEKRRKRFEKETEKRVKKFEKSSFGKRIVSFREDTQKQIESNVESFLSLFPVASSAQIKRLERKVTTLTRKVSALEKAGAAKARTAPPTAVKAEVQASA